jgi:carboxylate-amine ligase
MAQAVAARQLSLGVEEEYQIVDPETRELRARAQRVLKDAERTLGEEVTTELRLSQIETCSAVCRSLSGVREELVRLRRGLIEAAAHSGDCIVAGGTHPFSASEKQPFTPKERYRKIVADYQFLARELLICGCHVHVGIGDHELGLQVMNRARVWLAPLIALSANSPFWEGEDTGYMSFRSELWCRWPNAGPPHHFESRAEYDRLVRDLIQTEVIEDPSHIHWDVRLPEHVPTVEFRVADVCLTIDEAVMIAGLVRALAQTCLTAAQRDEPYGRARQELVHSAHWRAARFGLRGELIDLERAESVPARQLIDDFLRFLRPALEELGDWDEVSEAVAAVLKHGSGAERQRRVYERTGRLEDVIDFMIAETARGTGD